MTANRAASSLSRRTFLKGAAAAGVAAGSGAFGVPFVHAADPVKLGVVLPFSGGNELYGQQSIQGIAMAVKEANDAGGVLGRQIDVIKMDSKTDPKTAVERCRQLLERDQVLSIVGPVTSAERNAVRSTMERAKTPLLYATDYEGGACSRYIFAYSTLPDHYVGPFMPWLKDNYGSTFYLFGADYVWPHKTNAAIKETVARIGGKIVGEEYTPWDVKDFTPTLRKIQASGAKVVILTLPGADGLTFLKQFDAQGLKRTVRLAQMDLNESYLLGLTPQQSEGLLGCAHFVATLDRPEAQDFVRRQKAMFGQDVAVSYLTVAHYGLTAFFLQGIKKADSLDKEKINDAMLGLSAVHANGTVRIRPEDRHVDLNMVIHEAQGGKLVQRKYIGPVKAKNQCA